MTCPTPIKRSQLLLISILFGWLLSSLSLIGQQVATGSIEGRVYNPANSEYVGNAEIRLLASGEMTYSESDGSFRFANVPVGEAAVSITYTGYETQTVTFNVVAGQTATKEISIYSTATAKKATDDGTIMLEAFTVNTEREGNAKAIMAQRRNMDITTSVSSDIFGDVTDGNVGEFLKYLPGVDLDYVESEARGPRIGGMEAQYVGVSIDGVRMASADANRTGAASRATSFEGFSISAIDSIEIYYTTSPESDADSPAGTINMKPKKAFDRKGRHFGFNTSLNFNSEEFTWRQTVGPDDRWHYKWKPNYSLDFSDSYSFKNGQKLGILFAGSRANSYTEQYSFTYDYNRSYNANDPRPLVIRQIDIKDGPKFILKDSATLNVDWKVSSRLVLSTSLYYTFTEGQFHNRNFTFVAANNNSNVNNGRSTVGGDGITTVVANRTSTNTVPTLNNGGGSEAKRTWQRTLPVKFEYKANSWVFDGSLSRSYALNDYNGIGSGFIGGEGQGVPSSWIATRPNGGSQEWTIRQTGGPDWFDYHQWGTNSTDNRAGGTRVTDSGRTFDTEIWNAQLSAAWATPLRKFPTRIKFGGKWNEEIRHHMNTADYEIWSYVGPNGNRIYRYNATTGLPEFYVANTFNGFSSWGDVGPQYISPHPFETGTTHGLTVFNINGVEGMPPRANRVAIAQLFNEHPEWFVRTGNLDNFYNAFIANRRNVKQWVEAGYVQADTKISPQLSVRYGLRFEKTLNKFMEFDPRTRSELTEAGYPFSTSTQRATTFEGLAYQFFSKPQVSRKSDYLDWFPSVNAKYNISRNTDIQLGYNQSIGRPPIDNLTGVWVINEDTQRITAPNSGLLPEYHKKWQARFATYIEPSGQFTVSVAQINTRNMRLTRDGTAEEYGITDPDYETYIINSSYNAPGENITRTMDVAYNQTLAFLPKALRGTTVGLNYGRTYVQRGVRRGNMAPHRFSGRLGYSYQRFNGSLGFVWRDRAPMDSTNIGRFYAEQFTCDTSLNWKLGNNVWLFIQGRNIFKEPVKWFESPPGTPEGKNAVLRQYQYYGSNWVFGIRGNF